MNYLPHFLNPLTALIAAALAIPALLVLYFLKLRRREMVVSSTLLWKKAIQDLQVNAPFQKLRRNLLLLLQLLLLLMLCLALSRPVSNYTPGAGKMTVILIDRSASMSARDMNCRTPLDANEVSLRANLKYSKIGLDESGNIGVVALSAKRNYERPTEVQVFARLANYGPSPTKAQVQLSVEMIDPTGAASGNTIRSVA